MVFETGSSTETGFEPGDRVRCRANGPPPWTYHAVVIKTDHSQGPYEDALVVRADGSKHELVVPAENAEVIDK